MSCARCQKNPAEVLLKTVVNGQESEVHLCPACAQESGASLASLGAVNFPSITPALSELFGILSTWPVRPTAAAIARSCPRCQWTLERFQKTGRMGCPDCYAHFRVQAKSVLKRVQGASLYKGRRAAPDDEARGREQIAPLPELRSRLESSIREQRFEEAAVLRDMIRKREAGE